VLSDQDTLRQKFNLPILYSSISQKIARRLQWERQYLALLRLSTKRKRNFLQNRKKV